jgi:hypothetical protein
MAAAYREGLGLAAVIAVQEERGMRIVAHPPGGAEAATDRQEDIRLWCRREAEAVCIAAAATKVLRRKPDGNAEDAVLSAAEKLGIAVQTDEEVAGEAAIVAARIALEMQKQQQSGGLKSVNQAYRNYRLEATARGERALRYDAWMRRYREEIVRQVAAALRQF